MAASIPPDQTQAAEDLLTGLTGRIRPVRPSPFYFLGLVVVTGTMLLLPLIYLLVIVGVASALVIYCSWVLPQLILPDLRQSVLLFAAYFGPPIVGGLLLVFLLKPLLVRGRAASAGHLLHRHNEPLLFAFVDRLCGVVGAPLPCEVRIDADVNASAGLRGGLASLLRRDLVLTIGVPLLAGMDLVQFTGVLAHELGHFTQGGAMRLNEIVRGINDWLARLVYDRDRWDRELEDHAWRGERWWLRVLCLPALAGIAITRRFFWLLMILGQAISCALMRQMEYDADRHEARVVGRDGFASTLERLAVLSMGAQLAYDELGEQYRDRMLPQDVVALIVSQAQRVLPEQLAAMRRQMKELQGRLLATHPSDARRRENLSAEPEHGMISGARPALSLVLDMPHISRTVTLLYYEQVIGSEINRTKLISAEQLGGRQDTLQQQKEAFAAYFQEAVSLTRPLVILRDELRRRTRASAAVAELKQARADMEASLATARRLCKRHSELDDELARIMQVRLLLSAGLRLSDEERRLRITSKQAAEDAELACKRNMDEIAARLRPYEALVQKRLLCALRLLEHTQVAARFGKQTAVLRQRKLLIDTLNGLYDAFPVAVELRREHLVFHTLLARAIVHTGNEALEERIRYRLSRVHFHLNQLRDELRHAPYPFEHAEARPSLARYAIESFPRSDDAKEVYEASHTALERFFTVYLRVLGQLAGMAARVETALGLPPPGAAAGRRPGTFGPSRSRR